MTTRTSIYLVEFNLLASFHSHLKHKAEGVALKSKDYFPSLLHYQNPRPGNDLERAQGQTEGKGGIF